MIKPIICKNDVREVLNNLQEYADNGGIMNSLCLVDCSDNQVVVLVSDRKISEDTAAAWWSGYVAALNCQ